MHLKNSKKIKIGNSGETLVETVVSFAVIMIVIVMVTAMIISAGSFMARADAKSTALNTAIAAIDGSTHTGTPSGDTLDVNFSGSSISIPIVVEEEDPLFYFYTK